MSKRESRLEALGYPLRSFDRVDPVVRLKGYISTDNIFIACRRVVTCVSTFVHSIFGEGKMILRLNP